MKFRQNTKSQLEYLFALIGIFLKEHLATMQIMYLYKLVSMKLSYLFLKHRYRYC